MCRDMQPLQHPSQILDISFSGQLTPVKTRYLLIKIADHIASSMSGHFSIRPLTKCWFLIESQTRGRLTSCNQDQVLQKLVNANPGFLYSCFVQFEIIQTQNRRPNNIQNHKVTKLKSKLLLILGQHNQALNNSTQPRSSAFRFGEICIILKRYTVLLLLFSVLMVTCKLIAFCSCPYRDQ